MDADWRVGVELCYAGSRDLVSGPANIGRGQEELRGEVGEGDWRRVIDSQALYASQGNVLGDLDTEALQADHEDVGSTHTLHGLVAKHVELTAIKGLIDFGLPGSRTVNLHFGSRVGDALDGYG